MSPHPKFRTGFLSYLIAPSIAIALPKSAMAVKMLRSSVITQLHMDYVRTAYSRGNRTGRVLGRHVLKNALIPVLTFWAMTIADIMANSIILEQVFTIPGMGSLLITSISNRDYPVVQGIIVLIAAMVVLINFTVDILYGKIRPADTHGCLDRRREDEKRQKKQVGQSDHRCLSGRIHAVISADWPFVHAL